MDKYLIFYFWLVRRMFPDDKDYQISKRSIEKQYKRISEKLKDVDIEGLKVSNKAVKILNVH